MHIPDGFLDAKTAVTTGVVALGALAVALRHVRTALPQSRIPLLGVSAAFIFAAQMINFPIGWGTSGHLVGSVLATVLLGPSAAFVALAAVLLVQCFMFADGGITALGANTVNMGLIGCIVGWAIYAPVARAVGGVFGKIVAATVAAWLSTVLAATACAGELALSGTIAWSAAFPAMAGIHMIIGVGEAVITAVVLAGIAQVRPELLDTTHQPARAGFGPMLAYGMLLALGLGVLASPWTSALPDGLDKTAAALRFAEQESEARAVPALLSDYKMPHIGSETLATSVAGGVGTLVVFGLGWLLARTLVSKNRPAVVPVTEKA